MSTAYALGIDVGGSGIKGAPVDVATGALVAPRMRIDTPQKSTPDAVAAIIAQIVESFDDVHDGSPIGVTIPGVVMHGVVKTAANIDPSWIDCAIEKRLEDVLQHDVVVVNDADAAGVGELHHGAAKGEDGLVILTTLGTGIGTAVMYNGVLIPNSEFGHLELNGMDAEDFAASSVKEAEGLNYEQWAVRLQKYYRQLESLTWPDLFVVGGGISKKADKFLPLLDIRTPIVPAKLRNEAGIVGAAVLATHKADKRSAR